VKGVCGEDVLFVKSVVDLTGDPDFSGAHRGTWTAERSIRLPRSAHHLGLVVRYPFELVQPRVPYPFSAPSAVEAPGLLSLTNQAGIGRDVGDVPEVLDGRQATVAEAELDEVGGR
jgi:hypothetical protein